MLEPMLDQSASIKAGDEAGLDPVEREHESAEKDETP